MLEKTLQEMKNFEAIYKEANDLFKRTRKEINEIYKEPMATNKLGEASRVYNASIQKSKDKGIEISNKEFNELKNNIIEYITTPIPSEYLQILQTIKMIGKNVTELEIKSLINKFNDNYLALKELICIANDCNIKIDYIFIGADDVINYIDDVHNQVVRYFNNYIPNTYETKVMIDEKGVITQLNNYIDKFIGNVRGV